jgi:hypothetical protein
LFRAENPSENAKSLGALLQVCSLFDKIHKAYTQSSFSLSLSLSLFFAISFRFFFISLSFAFLIGRFHSWQTSNTHTHTRTAQCNHTHTAHSSVFLTIMTSVKIVYQPNSSNIDARTRRVPEEWLQSPNASDARVSHFDYSKLHALCVKSFNLNHEAGALILSYLDVDGDTCEFSSDEEMLIAVRHAKSSSKSLQFKVQYVPTVVATPELAPIAAAPAAVPRTLVPPPVASTAASFNQRQQEYSRLLQQQQQQHQQQRQQHPLNKIFEGIGKSLRSVGETVLPSSSSSSSSAHRNSMSEAEKLVAEVFANLDVAFSRGVGAAEAQRPSSSPSSPSSTEQRTSQEEARQALTRELSPTTVHRRHTCDGCSQHPILGLRFRCNELFDYDLCTSCMAATPDTSSYTFQTIEGAPINVTRGSGKHHHQNKHPHRGNAMCPPPPHCGLSGHLFGARAHHGPRRNNSKHHHGSPSPKVSNVVLPPKQEYEKPHGSESSKKRDDDAMANLMAEAIRRSIIDQENLELKTSSKASAPSTTSNVVAASSPSPPVLKEESNLALGERTFYLSGTEGDEESLLTVCIRDLTGTNTIYDKTIFKINPSNTAIGRVFEMYAFMRNDSVDDLVFTAPLSAGCVLAPAVSIDPESFLIDYDLKTYPIDCVLKSSMSATVNTPEDTTTTTTDVAPTTAPADDSVAPPTSTAPADVITEEKKEAEAAVLPVAEAVAPKETNAVIEEDDSWNTVENDADLASAASMIGSLLYDYSSDGDSYEDNLTQAQIERWGAELVKLGDLGLVTTYGRQACVDALERLQAANIGSGEGDVILDKCVDEIMKFDD